MLLGIDIGTSTIKAVLVDEDGHVLGRVSRPYPTARRPGGGVEQDPADWTTGVEAALLALAEGADLSGLKGVGLCSQVSTHTFIGPDGRPLRPALVWQDVRAGAVAADLDRRISDAERLAWFGGPSRLDASHALARMEWVRRVEPEVWRNTAHVLSPKAVVLRHLTGEIVDDPLAAVGLTGAELHYIRPLLDLVPGARERLAPLARPTAIAGRVRRSLPGAGAPVIVGTMDAWSGMLGVGATAEGSGLYSSGTSEVLGVVSERDAWAPGTIVFPSCEGIRFHAAPTQSGGASLLWLAAILGTTPGALAAGHDLDMARPLFLPHLQGERAPFWDASARGVFLGLETGHDRQALTLSVMEGVAFSARAAFEALRASTGIDLAELRCGGGGFRSDDWTQIRADALGLPLRRAQAAEIGAVGALVLAAVGIGGSERLADAAQALVAHQPPVDPKPARQARLDERYSLWLDAYAVNRDLNRRLAGE